MKNKNDVKLCGVAWPSWILLFFPNLWLFDILVPFAVNSAVLLLALLILKVPAKKQWYKKYIFNLYAFGFASYAIGVAYMLMFHLGFRLFRHGTELFLTVPAVIISAVMIFFFDYFITFKKEDKKIRLKLSLVFSFATAPYVFMMPADWLMLVSI